MELLLCMVVDLRCSPCKEKNVTDPAMQFYMIINFAEVDMTDRQQQNTK